MCQPKKHITFCSCIEKEPSTEAELMLEAFKAVKDEEEYNRYDYTWTLLRTIRNRTERERRMIIGSIVRPSRRLDEELNAIIVMDQLNGNAEFDFDYSPQEGDELHVGLSYRYLELDKHPSERLPTAMRLLYQNQKWTIGYHGLGECVQKRLNEGKIKLEEEGGQ